MSNELKKIADLNEEREVYTLDRRIMKISEEAGELAEAYLSVTSINNSKDKNWMDVMEEAVDVAIVAMDVALYRPEHARDEPFAIHYRRVENMFEKKLKKWKEKLENDETVMY
jgi:NTP pyrophosphatase (non-canonical NTP hydrolase)